MKAYVLHNIGNIRLENIPVPSPSVGEVLVKIKATGVCGSDIPRIYDTGAHTQPLIPGHEFSGEVVETGNKVNQKWIYKRVGIFPMIPCYKCAACQKKEYEICRDYNYLGSRRNGGFAEYAVVPEKNLIILPEQVSFEEAAMLEPMSVAVHAMRRINPNKQETVVVCGLGTIGLLLVMFLKEAGIEKLLVIGNKEFQKNCCINMGIEEANYCDIRVHEVKTWLMERTTGKGADIVFECVGKNETLMQAIDFTAPSGKVMLVGNPYSDMYLRKNIYWKILRNQLTIMGTWNSSFTGTEVDDWHYVLARLVNQCIMPKEIISHIFTLEELKKGFHIMKDKLEDYGKIMGIIT